MIDLHLHTNASDGRCTPRELVARAAGAGLSTISVVDHDTFAAQGEVAAEVRERGLRMVPGIEITAVWQGTDVHVLGYYLDPTDASLAGFLEWQRADRIRRVNAMLDRLRSLGMAVSFEDVTAGCVYQSAYAIGRPQVARALVRAGFAASVREAFDRYLADGQPAYVPRSGSAPADVVRLIAGAGGIASLAHPGLLGRDDLIPGLVDAGMQAIEVYHPDHPPEAVDHYRAAAARFGIAVSGGSDYHADDDHGASSLGTVTLPAPDFLKLQSLVDGASS